MVMKKFKGRKWTFFLVSYLIEQNSNCGFDSIQVVGLDKMYGLGHTTGAVKADG